MGFTQTTVSILWMLFFAMVSNSEQRSSSEDLLYQQMDVEWPSCSELRAMWLNLQNHESQSEITNEIPVFSFERAFHPRQSSGHRKKHRKFIGNHGLLIPKVNDIPEDQTKYLLTPSIEKAVDHQTLESSYVPNHYENAIPSPDDPFGPFGSDILIPDVPNQASTNADILSDLVLAGPPSGEIVPHWGSEDMGSFGSFSDDDEAKARRKATIRAANFGDSTWHETLRNPGIKDGPNDDRQANCEAVENRECSNHAHCTCRGWSPSRCIGGRCRITSSLMSGDLMDTGAWHSAPLPFSKLGLVTRRKRRTSSSAKLM